MHTDHELIYGWGIATWKVIQVEIILQLHAIVVISGTFVIMTRVQTVITVWVVHDHIPSRRLLL